MEKSRKESGSKEQKFFVVCNDNAWKDRMCCECPSMEVAETVARKWRSHSEKKRIRIIKSAPRYPVTWYTVTDSGTIKYVMG